MKQEIYDEVHKGVDAHEASNKERAEKELQHNTELIYGEVVFMYFIPILEYAKPKLGEIFWDLGCGAGKPLITASLAFPELKVCRGIELLEKLADLAEEIAVNTKRQCEEKQSKCAPIEIIKGDILKYDWFDADIVFIAAVCFPEPLLAGIADLCENLKKGTRVISLKELPKKSYFEEYANIKAKYSWGTQITYYYLVV